MRILVSFHSNNMTHEMSLSDIPIVPLRLMAIQAGLADDALPESFCCLCVVAVDVVLILCRC